MLEFFEYIYAKFQYKLKQKFSESIKIFYFLLFKKEIELKLLNEN